MLIASGPISYIRNTQIIMKQTNFSETNPLMVNCYHIPFVTSLAVFLLALHSNHSHNLCSQPTVPVLNATWAAVFVRDSPRPRLPQLLNSTFPDHVTTRHPRLHPLHTHPHPTIASPPPINQPPLQKPQAPSFLPIYLPTDRPTYPPACPTPNA